MADSDTNRPGTGGSGEKLRAVLIGCGGISAHHAQGFSIPGRCRVVAGADISAANLQRTCDACGIPGRYLDYREMLDREKPDIAAICTWPGSHAEAAVECARRGLRGVLTEKPMAVSLSECDQMIDACRSAGTVLGVGYQRRFAPSIAAARGLVASGGLGDLLFLRTSTGDGLANNASHMIDAARQLLGDRAPVSAFAQVERRTDRYERGVPIEDCTLGEIGFEGGGRVLVESDLESAGPSLLVVGTRGMISVDSEARILAPDGEWRLLEGPHSLSQHGAFLDSVERGAPYPANGQNGRAAIECVAGLFESARQRSRVALPLINRDYPLADMIRSGILPVVTGEAYDIRGSGPRWRAGS
jgi:predicted dehydrogenase